MDCNDITSGVYKHYKGGLYQVLFVAKHTETLEEFVVYQALYDSKDSPSRYWVRPKSMFLEEVTLDGSLAPRFAKCT